MYYVLVDAGRTGLLGGEFQEMLRCIRCGACMNHCPVYQKIGGHAYGWVYPGPMGSVLTPSYVGIENALDLPHAATLCSQCSVVCPVKIPLPDLLRKLREKQWERGLRPWYEKVGVARVGLCRHAAVAVRVRLEGRGARAALDGRRCEAHPQPAGRRAAGPSAATSRRRAAAPSARCTASAGSRVRRARRGRSARRSRRAPTGTAPPRGSARRSAARSRAARRSASRRAAA